MTDKDFDAEVLRSPVPVVVELFADWERPWRGLGAEDWNLLRDEHGDAIRCASLDTAANRAVARRYGAETIPHVLVFHGESLVARFFGRTKVDEVRTALARALSNGAEVEARVETAANRRNGAALGRRAARDCAPCF